MINFFPEPLKKKKPKIPLFIHIPKAAGTSIRNFTQPYWGFYDTMREFLFRPPPKNDKDFSIKAQEIHSLLKEDLYSKGNVCPTEDPSKPSFIATLEENGLYFSKMQHSHMPISFYENYLSKEQLDECFIFTFVRNPFDRLVSSYHYLTAEKGPNDDDKEVGQKLSKDFKTFVKKDLAFYLPGGGYSPSGQTHFVPMHWYIDGNYDFIGKVENINEDFKRICDKASRDRITLPVKNKSNHKHYSEYYDEETREIVAEKYAKDLEMFGYEFGK